MIKKRYVYIQMLTFRANKIQWTDISILFHLYLLGRSSWMPWVWGQQCNGMACWRELRELGLLNGQY